MGVFSTDKKVVSGKPAVAGSSPSIVDPKKPAYRSGSGYSPEENINAAPGGGKKGKAGQFGGQVSDDQGAKDDLVPQSSEQKDPYKARGSDFPVKRVAARSGQSGAGDAGFSSGYNELATYSSGQEGPRTMEDDGMGEHGSGTPVPGNRGGRVSAMFPVEVNKGESSSDTGEIGLAESVNLQTGYIECSGSRTPVQELPEDKVSIGGVPTRNMKAGLKGKNY